ncbi:MAG: ribosome-binding ATPase [Moorella sp. (in: firmicutes)]|uniref:redox-regulated ATPase YchF n=1 Tax=Moorella sp. E308F TaxID=2572682 RepID=UPI0010FFACE0|nr:redox-regulated ATPase YchF [Moorella sp. E308F]MDK2817374.1 ribosome-binding ATPase [Moorella sp. (in: firmicutes)]MDK2894158.1 ribosome-binding ATPase [Moorella sp. (in: firmicutes)]GEA14417.1 ribosome-binding ATPase YchF [Moorella sp. E308F]
MALTCGIIGLPLVGKTTLFNLLTQAEAETSAFAGRTKTNIRTAPIPDPRLDFLASLYHPRKVTPATLEIIDVPGLTRGTGAAFLAAVREVDALIHVVRTFQREDVLHVEGSLNPVRDLEMINAELLLADLQLVETRLERIAASKKVKGDLLAEQSALRRCQEALEAEKPLLEAGLTPDEWQALRHMGFLTTKPMIIVVNIDEEQLREGHYEGQEEVEAYAAARGIPVLNLCAALEAEIARLEPADREVFLKEMGITEPGIDRLARAIYRRLGLISFLTAGEDEVRAWTIKEGTTARAAAGKIHSDIERGFIRAEVVSFSDLARLGDMNKVKENGLARLEGKEYIVQDGDIINFRFNV